MMERERAGILSFERGNIRLTIGRTGRGREEEYFLDRIEHCGSDGWAVVAGGRQGREFVTSLGACGAAHLEILEDDEDHLILAMSCRTSRWEAAQIIVLQSGADEVRITQDYTFHHDVDGYVSSGLYIEGVPQIRYTYPLQAYDKPVSELEPIRCDCAWAVPVPFHVLDTGTRAVIYGIDRRRSAGTLDVSPDPSTGRVRLGLYYPDTAATRTHSVHFFEPGKRPETTFIQGGRRVTLAGVVCVKNLRQGDLALLEAERLAAGVLLCRKPPGGDMAAAADRIAGFFSNCDLWEPDALGEGRGWYRNMWMRVAGPHPRKGVYYDLGWGEGCGSMTISALVRNWKRTGREELLPYADEMSRNIRCFGESRDGTGLFYDRYYGEGHPVKSGYTDFTGSRRIWSHSAGQIGYRLLRLYLDVPDYPHGAIRELWLDAARSIAQAFGKRQTADGDIQDGYDEGDGEINRKPHRIPARAMVCGLWTLLSRATGDEGWTDRALRLARAVSPEICRYEFYNQMIDGHGDSGSPENAFELIDGENACYALEGLLELCDATRDRSVLRLCRQTAAYVISWIYFYDVPHGYRGVTRGGTVCRMPDYPLLYLGAGAVALMPLLRLSELTGDALYEKIAREILACITQYQWDCPDKPWHGGMIHAYDQRQGLFWGPDFEGQVDSGMTSGMGLAVLETVIGRLAT